MAQKQIAPRKTSEPRALRPQALWKKIGADYLLTNDSGHYAWLKEKDFAPVTTGTMAEKAPRFAELAARQREIGESDAVGFGRRRVGEPIGRHLAVAGGPLITGQGHAAQRGRGKRIMGQPFEGASKTANTTCAAR